jgi:outer membrane lipoprotein carrier protein
MARTWIRTLTAIAVILPLWAPIAAGADVISAKTPVSHELRTALDNLQRHYRETRTFSAKFHEQIATVGAPVRERNGTVSFRKPGRMRWDFASPDPQTIVSDGETLYSYDPELNQVVQTPLKQALKSGSSTSFLLGMGDVDREFDATLITPAPPDGLVHLRLRQKSGGYRVEVGLDPKNYDLVTLTLTDQLNDVTKVNFSDVRNNIAMADSTFAFKAPPGADIVTAPATP